MNCVKCGNDFGEGEKFCRKCGADVDPAQLQRVTDTRLGTISANKSVINSNMKDPDELAGNGVASVMMGDGFFIVAVLLTFMNSSVSSFLWLLLLIPAFFFFGKGFSDLFQARQIRRRLKQNESEALLPTLDTSDLLGSARRFSGELVSAPSVTERTTRQLK